MSAGQHMRVRDAAPPGPHTHSRTLLFGVLIAVFAAGLLLAGHRVGMTTGGLPHEQHPSLLTERRQIAAVRARLGQHPYDYWYERLRARARADDRAVAGEPLPSVQLAKALACLHTLAGDRNDAERATALLLQLRRTPGLAGWRSSDDLVTGAADLAIAYDLLAPHLLAHPAAEQSVRELVLHAGNGLWGLGERWAEGGGTARRMRYASALGLCALAVSDGPAPKGEPGPRDWYRKARAVYRDALRRGVAEDGAFAEGPGQQFEAAALYLPFAAACRHVVGDDLLSGAALAACEWSVRLRLSNGDRPSADGSAQSPSCSFAVWPTESDGGLYRWDAAAGGAATTLPDAQLCEALLLGGAPARPARPQWTPTQVPGASGDVVFRSGWDASATYLLMRAESGQARAAGGALEQADSTSITVAKGSELLTLDAGYGGARAWAETAGGQGHSVVLMDGEGPPLKRVLGRAVETDADTHLQDVLCHGGLFEAATAVRRQPSAVFSRTVLFVHHRDFVVIDRVAPGRGEHAYQWRLHCNAGDGTGGTLRTVGNRAELARPGARMGIWLWTVGASGDVDLRVSEGRHYLGSDTARGHLLLEGDAPRGRRVAFVSVLSPRSAAGVLPRVMATQGDGWLRLDIGAHTHCLVSQGATGLMGADAARSDGNVLVWEDGAGGDVRSAGAVGASQLRVGHQTVSAEANGQVLLWEAEGPARRAGTPPAAKQSAPRK